MYDYSQYGLVDEYPEMDDRAFVDYITSCFYFNVDPLPNNSNNNDAEFKKYWENNNFTKDFYNFGSLYPGYEPYQKSKINFYIIRGAFFWAI